jgi:hypothetical protein
MARPIPRAAPVTTATFPESEVPRPGRTGPALLSGPGSGTGWPSSTRGSTSRLGCARGGDGSSCHGGSDNEGPSNRIVVAHMSAPSQWVAFKSNCTPPLEFRSQRADPSSSLAGPILSVPFRLRTHDRAGAQRISSSSVPPRSRTIEQAEVSLNQPAIGVIPKVSKGEKRRADVIGYAIHLGLARSRTVRRCSGVFRNG